MLRWIFLCYFFSGLSAQGLTKSSQKTVIDHHVHVACFGYQSDCYLSSKVQDNWRFWFYQKIFDFWVDEAKKHGDGFIFDKLSAKVKASKYVKEAVVLALDEVYSIKGERQKDKTEFYVPNDFVYKNTQRLPNLAFAASVHPYRKDALAELERVKKMNARYIKLLPAIQRFFINDPSLVPYYKKLVELKLPLLIHVDDENSFSQESKQYSEPAHLELPLSLGVDVIAAHAGSHGERNGKSTREIVVELAKKYPNLLADISALTIFATRKGHIKQVAKVWQPERLLYGSDYPLSTPLLTSPWFYVFDIGFSKAWEISRISNLWDMDIELKLALGMPKEVLKSRIQ